MTVATQAHTLHVGISELVLCSGKVDDFNACFKALKALFGLTMIRLMPVKGKLMQSLSLEKMLGFI